MIDSHCHLDFEAFNADRDKVIDRARAAGITRMLTIALGQKHFAPVLALTERYAEVFCALGIHPLHVDNEQIRVPDLVAMAHRKKVVAFGETGIDRYHGDRYLKEQKASFAVHLQAGIKSDLPVIIHSRNAEREILETVDQAIVHGPLRGVLHCFDGSIDFAYAMIKRGFYISFSGLLTFKKRDDLRQIAAALPSDKILVETDAPYLSPHPLRGKRNEPGHIVHTAAAVAVARGVEPDAMIAIMDANFYRLFPKARSIDPERKTCVTSTGSTINP